MRHLIVVWALTAQGATERMSLDHYENYDQCHTVIHYLRDRNPKGKPWHRVHEYFLKIEGKVIMFEDYCNGNI